MKTRLMMTMTVLIVLLIALPVINRAMAAPAIVDSGSCGTNVTWTLDEQGLLTISGTGDMADNAFENRTDIVRVKIGNGITSIESCAFRKCSLTSITIPNTVTIIGDMAFYNCENLKIVTIPNGVASIGDYAFSGCSRMERITIPNSVQSIGDNAFKDRGSSLEVYCYESSYAYTWALDHNLSCTDLGEKYFPIQMSLPETCMLDAGKSEDLVPIFFPDGTYDLVWTSSDPTIVSVSGGTVTGLAKGTATITARCAREDGVTVTASCAVTVNACTHIPVTAISAIEPTCTTAGRTAQIVCSECGAILSASEVIPALEHDVILHEARAVTCTEIGWDAYETCSRCDYSTYAEIPAKGHTVIQDAYIPPTRTTWGAQAGSHCSVCGEILEGKEPVAPLKDDPVVCLPADVEALGEEAYMNSGVVCVTLPAECKTIGAKAFAQCPSLVVIEIPAGCTSIADDAFDGSPDVVIVTTSGSFAAGYADQHQITYMIIH